MKLRDFDIDRDFDVVKTWITDEKTHAMWSAFRFQYPLDKEDFGKVLGDFTARYGDRPTVAELTDGTVVGFFSYSGCRELNEGRLAFIVVSPDHRGKGIAGQMLHLAIDRAFEDPDVALVALNVFSSNPRARKCYEKVGFRQRRVEEKAFPYHEEAWDRVNMIVTRENVSGQGLS
ncbi:MAG: GNAT family N-acetyltransferase [Lachnospiraceae bacterium]|nr:GNAT family N-acetyltransferase [Lachnospiraceae bacterium]